MDYSRFAAYHLPGGDLGDWGARWLGWDLRQGRAAPHPVIAGLPVAQMTATPRRYGFHATMKAPFRLADDLPASVALDRLGNRLERIAASHAPFAMAMRLHSDWGLLCLRPHQQPPALLALEAALVRGLDPLRAPLTPAETARRRPESLPVAAQTNLRDWGYPFVLDLFHYHLTLTGDLAPALLAAAKAALDVELAPMLADPMPVARIALVGEDAQGRFHLIADFPLTASSST